MFYAIPDLSLVSTRKSFANFLQKLDCTADDVNSHSSTDADENASNPRFPPQLDGNVFSYDPYRKCRSRNYRCCDDYESNCTEIYGGRYMRPFTNLYCPTPAKYRRGYRSGLPDSYRGPLEVYEPQVYVERDVITYGNGARERRIADREHVAPLVMNETRYEDSWTDSRHRNGYITDVECTTCVSQRVVCSRIGVRRVRGAYSFITECSRWRGPCGNGIGLMRGFDGESAGLEHERLGPIAESNEVAEMSGGLPDDGNEPSSRGYETAEDSHSFLAAETANPLQLNLCATPDKNKAQRTVLEVQAIIDKAGNNRTWVMNIEEICRTECCRYKRIGDEGVLQKAAPQFAVCKEGCWKLNNCKYELDCKHKPPAIRFFESLGIEYLEKIHAIRLQTKDAAFLNPFEVASAFDLIIRTFPKVQHAQIILHPDDDGEITDKASIKLLVRTFRRLERSLPLVEKLRIIGIEQHPRLMRKWSKQRKRWAVLRVGVRVRGRAISALK